MNEPGLVTISMNELQRVKIIEAVLEGRLSGVRAADQLGLSERQVSRLRRRFEAQRALALIRERYADFGPTLVRRLPAKASRSLAERCTNSMSTRSVQTQVRPRAVWNGPI